jgi:hypothetical protein
VVQLVKAGSVNMHTPSTPALWIVAEVRGRDSRFHNTLRHFKR